MKRRLFYVILIGMIVVLSGCQNQVESESKKNKPKDREALLMKERALSNQETEGLLTHLLTGIRSEMSGLQNTHGQWFNEQAIKDYDLDDSNFQNAIQITNKTLNEYVTENEDNALLPMYIFTYFCSCDSIDAITQGHIGERFESEMIDSETMRASYFEFEEYEGPSQGPAHTIEIEFKYEAETWKINDLDYISVEDQLIYATKEEVARVFNEELDEIYEYEEDGELYFEVYFSGDTYLQIKSSDTSGEFINMD